MPRRQSALFLPGNVDLEEMVGAALWMVDYHLAAVEDLNTRPGTGSDWKADPTITIDRRPYLLADINRLNAHLRSFFWELVATFDAMRFWVKETFGDASKQMAELEKAAESEWYMEVSEYRNFAHRGFVASEGMFKSSDRKLIARCLVQTRRGGPQAMIPDRLAEYQHEIQALFDRLGKLTALPATPSIESSNACPEKD